MSRDEWIRREQERKEHEFVNRHIIVWRNSNGPYCLAERKRRRNLLRSQMLGMRPVS